MVKPGTTIYVTISNGPEKKEFTVTVTCGAGGSVSPSGNQKVAEGGSVSFTITRRRATRSQRWSIDGMTVLPLTSYSFMNVDSNHTLYVTFRESRHERIHAPPAAGRGRMIYASGMAWMPALQIAPSRVSMRA